MVVVSGSNAASMASQLADAMGWEHHALETRRFPDTEGYIRIPTETIQALRDEPVVLVSNTFPDSGIVETLLMLDAIQDVRAGRLQNLREIGPQTLPDVGKGVILAVPYFGYSRQDKRFKPGESISARAIANMLATRCDGMVVLDLHAPAVLSEMSIPVACISAMPELADHLKASVNPDFILSPDKGAIDRASSVAQQIGCEFSYLEKTRIDAHTIVHKAKDLDVDGKSVAIVDDMIATGGTICRGCRGASKPRCCGSSRRLQPRPVHRRCHRSSASLRGRCACNGFTAQCSGRHFWRPGAGSGRERNLGRTWPFIVRNRTLRTIRVGMGQNTLRWSRRCVYIRGVVRRDAPITRKERFQ